jgi:outer membrane immunogenic protein
MKKLVVIFSLMVLAATVTAQSPLAKGRKQINAGVGISGWGIPIYVGMDFGVGKNFTLGFEGSFRFYNERLGGNRYNSTIIGISGNGNYHFNTVLNIPSEWDFYAGLNLGFFVWSTPSNYPGDGSSGLGAGLQVGGRYFFQPNFGLNVEFGGSNAFSGGKFGITYIF